MQSFFCIMGKASEEVIIQLMQLKCVVGKLVEAVSAGRPLQPRVSLGPLAQCGLKTVTVCYHSGLLCLDGSSGDG